MKRYIKIAALFAALTMAWGCENDGADIYSSSTTTPAVGIDDSELALEGKTEISRIMLEANFWWKASVNYPSGGDEQWCVLTPDEGFGNVDIEVTTTRNYSLSADREAVVVIESDAEGTNFKKEFTIKQAVSSPYIEIVEVEGGGTYDVPVTGGENILRLLVNDEWTAESSEPWCRVSAGGLNGDNELVVETDMNSTLQVRAANITITAANIPGLSYSFDVVQTDKFAQGVIEIEKAPAVFAASWEPIIGAIKYEVMVYDIAGNMVGVIDNGTETQVNLAADPIFATPVHAGYTELVLKAYSSDPSIFSESDPIGATSHLTSGMGTAADPYIIGDMQSLANITAVNSVAVNEGSYYILDFTPALSAGFEPICSPSQPFKGDFDGNSKTISGWAVTVEADARNYTGLFGGIGAGAKVYDLTFSDCRISLTKGAGSVSKTNNGFGFLAGVNSGEVSGITIRNSNVDTQEGTTPVVVGTVAGVNRGTIRNSATTGGRLSAAADRNKSDEFVCGGIAGRNEGTGTIDGCVNESTEILAMTEIGGLVGLNDGLIINSANKAKVTGNYYVGGIVGYVITTSNSTYRIENCYNSGTVIMDDVAGANRGAAYVGGITSRLYSTGDAIVNCFNSGEIIIGTRTSTSTTPARIGGLVGHINRAAHIRNSYFSGTITCADIANVGGLVGETAGYAAIIENCYSSGELVDASGSADMYHAVASVSSSVIMTGVYGVPNGGSALTNTTTPNMTNCATLTKEQLSASGVAGSLVGWDFSGIWQVSTDQSYYAYPVLRSNPHKNKGE